jgi:septal ring factor EnvC (AmiA/AmiB activator)
VRVEAEQRALQAIRELPLQLVGKPAAAIDLAISNLETEDFLASVPEAVRDQARVIAEAITPTLVDLRDARAAAETEAKRLADERAELEQQRKKQDAEQAERDRLAREQREREESERRAELKRQEDALAEQRRKFEEEQADLRRQQEAQRQREQEEADSKAAAERKRLDDEAAAAREAETKRQQDARAAHIASLKAGAPALRIAAAAAHELLCTLGQADHDTTITLGFAIEADAEHAKKTNRRKAA